MIQYLVETGIGRSISPLYVMSKKINFIDIRYGYVNFIFDLRNHFCYCFASLCLLTMRAWRRSGGACCCN